MRAAMPAVPLRQDEGVRGILLAGWLGCAGWACAGDWRTGVSSSLRDLPNPYEKDRQAAANGQKLYRSYCADCHAMRGQGSHFGPPIRTRSVARSKPGEIFWLLRTGLPGRRMPSFSFLSDKELWALVTHVRQMR